MSVWAATRSGNAAEIPIHPGFPVAFLCPGKLRNGVPDEMKSTHKAKPAPAVAGNGHRKSDQLGGVINPGTNTSGLAAQPGRRVFQFQGYYVLSHPVESIRALVDPRLVGMFRRILRGGQDCGLCGAVLNLDPESVASPGIVGFVHGDLDGIDAIGVAACVACTLRLGDEGVTRAIGQEFVDTCAGGGTVELVQGGVA
jgi:hypothetical protein